MSEKRVYSVTIDTKHDCVIMTEGEAMLLKMKYMPDIEMYDMTERHGMKPEYLHILEKESDSWQDGLMRSCGLDATKQFGGANSKIIWEFEDLIYG
jgi:hypothetical protein